MARDTNKHRALILIFSFNIYIFLDYESNDFLLS